MTTSISNISQPMLVVPFLKLRVRPKTNIKYILADNLYKILKSQTWLACLDMSWDCTWDPHKMTTCGHGHFSK